MAKKSTQAIKEKVESPVTTKVSGTEKPKVKPAKNVPTNIPSAGNKPTKSGEPDLSFIPIWAKKLNKPAEELTKALEKIVVELRKKHGTTWSEEKIYATARRRLYSDFKSEFKSSATYFLVNPMYQYEPNDHGFKKWKAAMDQHASNPKLAIANKVVKIEVDKITKKTKVVPLDTKLKTNAGKPNKRLGKPLPEHEWMHTIGGVGIPFAMAEKGDMSGLRPMEMINSRAMGDPTNKLFLGKGFEIGKWYKIKVSNTTPEDNTESWKLNGTTMTKWQEFKLEFDMSEVSTIFTDFFVPLNELAQYHESYSELNDKGTKEYNNRIVVTEGEVVDITLSDGENSHKMLIDDESLGLTNEDGEIVESVCCWIDKEIDINFGKYSHVLVFGSTSRGLKKDMDTQEVTDEWGNVTISVKGIIVTDLVEPDLSEDGEDGESDDEYEADAEDAAEVPDINAEEEAEAEDVPENSEDTTEAEETEEVEETEETEEGEAEEAEETEEADIPAEPEPAPEEPVGKTKIIKHNKQSKDDKW